MTFQENARCPVCLELGKLRYQFGSYVCDKCDQTFRADTLDHFMKAFEAGREFEKKKLEFLGKLLNNESPIKTS